jgi:Tfp pilus assembly protein PilF
MTQRALLVSLLLTAFGAAGCASTPGDKMRADVAVFQKEQTAEKLFERGKAFAAVGDMTRAEEYLAAAIEAGADDRKVMPLLLRVCAEDHRYRVAITYAEPYLKKHPGDVGTRFVLGTLYAAVGEPAQAKAELERVLAATAGRGGPGEANAHFALAVVMREQDDLVTADKHFREYLRLAPRGDHAEEARASLLKEVPQPAKPD